jgi:hypothetical protein
MNRRLVTSNDAVRHPFRQSLPLDVVEVKEPYRPRRKYENLRLFLTTYLGGFFAISIFIW